MTVWDSAPLREAIERRPVGPPPEGWTFELGPMYASYDCIHFFEAEIVDGKIVPVGAPLPWWQRLWRRLWRWPDWRPCHA